MEHIAALLLIVGCSGNLDQCKEIPAPGPVIYETMEECAADLPQARTDTQTLAARVFSQCVYVDPAMEEEDAELVWDITPDGHLKAAVIAGGATVASVSPREESRRQ
ncbi:MAG: hypothetical protein M9924_10190 [Rhizobiaceae bacterium]|nr:hypothetical protein [Rhizobiaceae bacterium]